MLIGYDTMGTETVADDVLIFMDSSDTRDHCHDGYAVENAEELNDKTEQISEISNSAAA